MSYFGFIFHFKRTIRRTSLYRHRITHAVLVSVSHVLVHETCKMHACWFTHLVRWNHNNDWNQQDQNDQESEIKREWGISVCVCLCVIFVSSLQEGSCSSLLISLWYKFITASAFGTNFNATLCKTVANKMWQRTTQTTAAFGEKKDFQIVKIMWGSIRNKYADNCAMYYVLYGHKIAATYFTCWKSIDAAMW